MSNQKVRQIIITNYNNIVNEMVDCFGKNLMDKWYPLAVDKEKGGYFTNISYNWTIDYEQPKMIVTQARHLWSTSKTAVLLNNQFYANTAEHGFKFLKNKMWDKKNGGFYQMRNREGGFSDYLGFKEEKRIYGNAFALYGLAAFYELTKAENVLEFAKEAFNWIEDHAYDSKYLGYFQFLTPKGEPFDKSSKYKTLAYDAIELGYKDQNSSIHLLEAYTELLHAWPDNELRKKLYGLLILIRDTITTPKGYMNLFFNYNWEPISFINSSEEFMEKNFRLNHVSFGHDYETAFLMLEASYELKLVNDIDTLTAAKKMVDHAIKNGWDSENGGFYDAGYYFDDENSQCKIIKATKNWWAQAEGLNILLIMSKIFPEEEIYSNYFNLQWKYIKDFLLDYEFGGWFEGGLDKEPKLQKGNKGYIWKCTYHTARSLMNCIKILADEDFYLMKESEGFRACKKNFEEFLEHWNKTAKKLSLRNK